MPTVIKEQTPVTPPSYQRAQARLSRALHIDASRSGHDVAFARTLPSGRSSGPPSLSPAIARHGPDGAPRTYGEENLLLISLLRTLWRLSSQDMHDWLKSWPALALACGLPLDKHGQPRIKSPSQQCKRRSAAGAPLHESLFVLVVLQALRRRLIGAHDLIIDSAPILAWRRRDPDAADLAYSRSLSSSTAREAFVCTRSSVAVLACLSSFCSLPAFAHDAPFAKILLAGVVRFYRIRPRIVRLDAAYWGLHLIAWNHTTLNATAVIRLPSQKPEEPFLLATNLDHRRTWQTRALRSRGSTSRPSRSTSAPWRSMISNPVGH